MRTIIITWNNAMKSEILVEHVPTNHPLIIPINDGEIVLNQSGTCYDDIGYHGIWVIVE